MATPPPFGKRVPGRAPPRRPAPPGGGAAAAPLATSPEQRAVFAAAAREREPDADRRPAVPRSFKAAFLAGLVVGCGLAGFDVTGAAGLARLHALTGALSGPLGVPLDTGVLAPTLLVPATILLGLLGGARAAAMSVLPVHWVLARAGWTGHGAYAGGGAVAAAGVAGALLLVANHPPAHGWAVELAAGAACGLLYRVFAGAGAR